MTENYYVTYQSICMERGIGIHRDIKSNNSRTSIVFEIASQPQFRCVLQLDSMERKDTLIIANSLSRGI